MGIVYIPIHIHMPIRYSLDRYIKRIIDVELSLIKINALSELTYEPNHLLHIL